MNVNNPAKIASPGKKSEDTALDQTLRPKSWDDFIGQDGVKNNLKILIITNMNMNRANQEFSRMFPKMWFAISNNTIDFH